VVHNLYNLIQIWHTQIISEIGTCKRELATMVATLVSHRPKQNYEYW